MTTDHIYELACELPSAARAELISRLAKTLQAVLADHSSIDDESDFKAELDRRVREHRAGNSSTMTHQEMLARFRAKHPKPEAHEAEIASS